MAKEEIKIIPTKEVSQDPIALQLFMAALMEFQYGEGQESSEAEGFIFGDSVPGVNVRDFSELELVLPELDFWIELGRKWQGTEQVSFRLYANKGLESRLAANLLQEEGFHFTTLDVKKRNAGDIRLPALVDTSTGSYQSSLVGIKSFLRYAILTKRGVKEPKPKVPRDLAFYTSRDFSVKPAIKTQVVTCFDEEGKEVYVGDINKAPHSLKSALDRHPYKDWHEVASFEIGNWQEILGNKEGEKVVDAKRKVVLFPEEVKALESGNDVAIRDSCCMYEVAYEAYFKDSEKLCRLYAYMLD